MKISNISEVTVYRTIYEFTCGHCGKLVSKQGTALLRNKALLCKKCLMLSKYGSTSNSNRPEISEKIAATKRAKSPEEIKIITQKRMASNLTSYGVPYTSSLPEVKQKRKNTLIKEAGSIKDYYRKITKKREKTCLEKYGVPCVLQSESVKQQIRKTMIEKYGGAPICDPEIQEKIISTRREKYGPNMEQISEKTRQTKFQKYQNPRYNNTAKLKQTCLEKYGVDSFSKTKEFGKKLSRAKQQCICEDGTAVDSSYEVLVWNYCKKNNIPIKRGPSIPYGNNHVSHIDFEINGKLFETKGGHLLRGVFDPQGITVQEKLDLYKQHEITLITDNLGIRILNQQNYSGEVLDINIFTPPL